MKAIENKCFIIILFLIQCYTIAAQEPMVAYRKEGIWHYFDTNGKLMWQPFLDVASFPNGWHNGLLKAAAMNIKGNNADNIGFERKQVLYDKKGKIVFQPKYDSLYRIMTGFDKAGYIQLRDLEEEKLILCDKKGNVVYKSPNGYCQYLGDGVVAYIKKGDHTEGDKTYVLWDIKTNKALSEINCVAFLGSFERSVVFSFNDKALYGMVNRKGEELLTMEWESNLLELEEEVVFKDNFTCLKNTKTGKWHLINKKGESVLEDFQDNFIVKNGFFTCFITTNGEEKHKSYLLLDTQVKEIDEKYGAGLEITEGGIMACENDENEVTLIDKNLKNIAVIKGVKDMRAVQNHFWIQSDKDGFYDSFNEKGQKVGTIQAEAIGKAAHHHVPFMQNGKWGLAHENGKEIVKPVFEFNSEEVPAVENGYWSINVTLPDNNHRFDFYNFQGKLVISSTSEKDGWDYILPQETVSYFYRVY
jgi:WG containing repeat